MSLVSPGRRRRDDTKLVDGGVGERVGHGTSWDMALAALAAHVTHVTHVMVIFL